MDGTRSCRPAVVGWAAVAATVVGYDVWAVATNRETLSGAFWRARRHRHARFVAVGVWTGLTWHLLLGDKRAGNPLLLVADARQRRFYAVRMVDEVSADLIGGLQAE